MKWLEISVEVDDEEMAEVVGKLLDRWGQGGVVQEQIFLHAQRGAEGCGPIVRVKTYVPLNDGHDEQRLHFEKKLLRVAQHYALAPPRFRELQENDWANAWKSYFQPQRIGQRMVLKLPEQSVAALDDDVVIDLEPGMAFGTGLHATTHSCLVCLEELVRRGDSVLDMGTGSGILAIAAAKLGAGRVLALDNDSTAVEVARRNIMLNSLADVIDVQEGSLDSLAGIPRPSWDGITINILAEVIAGMMDQGLASVLRAGGWLIAGGILESAEPAMEATFDACGMQITARYQEDHWVTLCATKSQRVTRLRLIGEDA